MLADAAGRTGNTVQGTAQPPLDPSVAVCPEQQHVHHHRTTSEIRRIPAENSASKYGVSGVEVLSETSLVILHVSVRVS